MRPNDRRGGGDSLAMSLVTTPAVVLQTYRYSETSKVVRLATRDLGVQSAIAKGALRPKSRFGAGLELLSEGTAQLYFRETRELHTLGAFDLINLRRDLAADVDRFAGATALTQVMLKMAPPAPLPVAFDTLAGALDALDRAADEPVLFSVADGGALCRRCGSTSAQPASRLPPRAYRDLVALNDPRADLPLLDPPHAAAHRRLVARFVRYHLGEAGPLSALDFWERRAWVPPTPTPIPSAAS